MVEASPELYQELSTHGWFPTFHCAVTKEAGTVKFNLARNDEGSSILELPPQSDYGCVLRERVTVPARTAASILEEIGWDSVDLIKMDIEGAEVQVLDSLGPDILDHVKQVAIEFHSAPVFGFDVHDQVEECLKRARKLGFYVIDFSYPLRRDVLLINTKLIGIHPIKRAWWRLIHHPPKPLCGLLRKLPTGLRAGLLSWRERIT